MELILKVRTAFTLIELLIVVAIIAILAAIAVPNFLEAQTRSKVSRVKSDLRTITTVLEVYRTDNNQYPPNDGVYNVLPKELSTPIAYISSAVLVDPFSDKLYDPVNGDLARYYTYHLIVPSNEVAQYNAIGRNPPIEATDSALLNTGALQRYGRWKILSNGPDQLYSQLGTPIDAFNRQGSVLLGSDVPYDSTNGTISFGNIVRSQLNSDGIPPQP